MYQTYVRMNDATLKPMSRLLLDLINDRIEQIGHDDLVITGRAAIEYWYGVLDLSTSVIEHVEVLYRDKQPPPTRTWLTSIRSQKMRTRSAKVVPCHIHENGSEYVFHMRVIKPGALASALRSIPKINEREDMLYRLAALHEATHTTTESV